MSEAATRRAVAAVAVALAALVAGCATEVDPALVATDAESAPATTEFLAAGSTADLLDQLLESAGVLSEAIVENEGQHELMSRIDRLWEAARPGVEASAPDHLRELDRAIVMLHTGVDRRRPADADKAYTNLVNLLAALPAPAQ